MNKQTRYTLLIFASALLNIHTLLFSKYEMYPFFLDIPEENIPVAATQRQIGLQQPPVLVTRQRTTEQRVPQAPEWIALLPDAITAENLDTLLRQNPYLTTLIIDGGISVSDYFLLRRYLPNIAVLISIGNELMPIDQYMRSSSR